MTNGAPATVAERPPRYDSFATWKNAAERALPGGDRRCGEARAHGEVDFTVRASDLLAVARYLRDRPGLEFIHLADLTAVDRSECQHGSASGPAASRALPASTTSTPSPTAGAHPPDRAGPRARTIGLLCPPLPAVEGCLLPWSERGL